MVVGCTWHMYLYVPGCSAGTWYTRCPGPVKNAVSPLTWTFEPSGLWRIRLWGAWLSWLSNVSVNAFPAAVCSVVGWKPAVAAPTGAVTVSPLAPCDVAADEAAEAAAEGAAEAAEEAAGLPEGAPDAAPDAAAEADAAGAYVQPGAG